MTPKVIHYCWFGHKPLPELALKCIKSWEFFFPNYEIKQWNEENFDVNIISYTKEAYAEKKYAFVSDYARFWILYHYGGIYFDTDVEVIKSFDDILSNGPYIGMELFRTYSDKNISPNFCVSINPGLGFSANSGSSICREMLDLYSKISFSVNNKRKPKTVVEYVSELFISKGLEAKKIKQVIDGVVVYPPQYFNPISIITHKKHITEETHSIHWYMGSWVEKSNLDILKDFIRRILPEIFFIKYNNLKILKRKSIL